MSDEPKLRGWVGPSIAAGAGASLVAAAFAHRLGLGSPGYARSPLVGVEMALSVVLLLVLAAQPVLAVVHLVARRPRALLPVAAAFAIALAAWIAAALLDGATLLHAT